MPPGFGAALRLGAAAGRTAARTAESAFLLALAAPVTQEAIERVLASPLTERERRGTAARGSRR